MADLAQDEVKKFRDKGWYWLFAYAVMPDHLHFLVRLRESTRTLGRVVATIKSSILYRSRQAGVDFAWQDYFHDHVVRLNEPPDEIVGYILRNPERAGLVKQGEMYPYAGVVDHYR